MRLAYNVRSNDQLPVFMLRKVRDVDGFIWLPTAASNKRLLSVLEYFDERKVCCLGAYFKNAVESGVTNYCGVCYSVLGKQFLRLFVLYEQMVEAFKRLSRTIPFEEVLLRAEDAGNAVNLHTLVAHHCEVVSPEFIFDEKDYLRMCKAKETCHVAGSVERHIADYIGAFVVFSHFIP